MNLKTKHDIDLKKVIFQNISITKMHAVAEGNKSLNSEYNFYYVFSHKILNDTSVEIST